MIKSRRALADWRLTGKLYGEPHCLKPAGNRLMVV